MPTRDLFPEWLFGRIESFHFLGVALVDQLDGRDDAGSVVIMLAEVVQSSRC